MRINNIIIALAITILPASSSSIDLGSAFGQAVGQMFQQGGSQQSKPTPAPQQQQVKPQSRNPQPAEQKTSKGKQEQPLATAFNSKPATTRLEIQKYLKQEGYLDGTPDGKWGQGTKIALELYADKVDLSDEITTQDGAAKVLQKVVMDSKNYSSSETTKQQTSSNVAAASLVVASAQATAGNSKDIQKLQSNYETMQQQLMLLQVILKDQNNRTESEFRKAKITAISAQIATYEVNTEKISSELNTRYSTPVKPANANLGITAKMASQIFPKIPYYIPGTKETGEMLVVPAVTEEGELKYEFSFLDLDDQVEKVRESIFMTPADIDLAISGFEKTSEWSNKAQAEGIRKAFEKRAACFPTQSCSEKKKGISSTEVDFIIYEDGATAAKVQRNKGTFSSGYNFSIESAMLLTAYLEYMRDVGQKEFSVGSMTEKDMHEMFK